MVDFIGYLAGFLAMISFLPQVIKTMKARSADDISLAMLMLTLATNILYLVYSIALSLIPIVVMLSIMTCIVLLQIVLTIRFRKASESPNQGLNTDSMR
jgi:MtN3 and saliva related transmembrane protein